MFKSKLSPQELRRIKHNSRRFNLRYLDKDVIAALKLYDEVHQCGGLEYALYRVLESHPEMEFHVKHVRKIKKAKRKMETEGRIIGS